MKEQPLWHNLYFQPAYTDLARMVGYDGLDVKEAKTKIQELLTKHSKEKLQKASDDLLQFNEQWVRLKTEARRLCWQLLGVPPEHPDYIKKEPTTTNESSSSTPSSTKKPRKPRAKKGATVPPAGADQAESTEVPRDAARSPAPVSIVQQYREAKERHPNMLLLFRMGDFYELFDEDARTAAKLLGLTLTTRARTTDMAGFPHHQLETYLRKLLKEGKRVAVCDQVDSDDGKRVKREVTRVVMQAGTEEETADALEEVLGQLADQ